MVASSLGSVVVPAPCSWPRQWSEQEPLLERQHERLEALLPALIELHRQPLAAELMEANELGEQLVCRRLLWDLRLHLRLGERWLAWLQQLQGWFSAHRQGPDAMAYGLVRRA